MSEIHNNCFADYAKGDELLLRYHDQYWGKPSHDEAYLIEMFILELFQAGLSWSIVYHKRDGFAQAFDHFDIAKIAQYDQKKIDTLKDDPNIIRNRLKIQATIQNAKIMLDIQKEFGSFINYVWHFTNDETIYQDNSITKNELSDDTANDMKKRGMKFAGSTTIYSFLQAIGVIYSHPETCACYKRDHADTFKRIYTSNVSKRG